MQSSRPFRAANWAVHPVVEHKEPRRFTVGSCTLVLSCTMSGWSTCQYLHKESFYCWILYSVVLWRTVLKHIPVANFAVFLRLDPVLYNAEPDFYCRILYSIMLSRISTVRFCTLEFWARFLLLDPVLNNAEPDFHCRILYSIMLSQISTVGSCTL